MVGRVVLGGVFRAIRLTHSLMRRSSFVRLHLACEVAEFLVLWLWPFAHALILCDFVVELHPGPSQPPGPPDSQV